jgi:hypothetical protein
VVLLDRDRPADALLLADEAVATGRRVFTEPHGYMAEALLAAGRARAELVRYLDAIPLLREALGMMEHTNAGQPSTAQTQSLLGRALIGTGAMQEGLALLRTSLAYFEANAQAGSPWLVRTKAALAAGS